MTASAAERTEQPTARRLRDARGKGQVAVSRDLSSAAAFAAGIAALVATAPGAVDALAADLLASVERASTADELATSDAISAVERVVWLVARASLPVGLAALVAGAAVGALQTHGLVAASALTPKLDRLDPIRGIKRLFQARTAVELVKTWLKVAVAATAVASAAIGHRDALSGVASAGPDALLAIAATIARDGAARAAIALGLVAAADLVAQRRLHLRELRMTRDEVRRDQKEDEGDPHVKSARRQTHREIAAEQMIVAATTATLVTVNPTHLAVALHYDDHGDAAPRVVAKGRGRLARRIRRAAEGAGVRVVEDRPLARSLFRVPVECEIPEALYEAVAELLALVDDES